MNIEVVSFGIGGLMSEQEPIPYKVIMSFKYDDVNSLWEKVKIPYITRYEAQRALRLLVGKFGKSKFAPPRFVSSDGSKVELRPNLNYKRFRVLKTFVCLSGNPSTLHRGWRDLVHTVSHWVYNYRKGYKNHFGHSIDQAKLEYEISQYVISSSWLEGGLKPKVIVLSKDEQLQKKINHLQSLINKWQTKQKVAITFIRKYNKKLKYYQHKK